MDVVMLSRIQFGVAAGFHFIFPPLTLGLTLILLIVEGLYLKRNDEIYKTISDFLVKMVALIFVLGTATGITLEFAFGTNWSEYSRVVGDVFGAPLAAEGILAFFMESIFLGVMVFGRNKVSPKMYFFSAFMVFFGAHLSGLWIIIANSFMQTPAGFEMVGGRAVLTNFWEAAINHSTIERFIHVIVASWITGSLMAAGISAWYLIKKQFTEQAKRLITISLVIFIVTSIFQLFTGHAHAVQVAETQPAKLAAYEGLWETQRGANLSVFGIPDEENEVTHLEVGFPKLLSLFVFGDTNAEILGLKEFPVDERPPVLVTFGVYHIMIGLGVYFILISFIGIYLLVRKKLINTKWYLFVLLFSIPLPHIANETGWLAAEIGRQPWAVYGILKTSDAASKVVPAGQILFTLIMFILIYSILFYAFIKLMLKIVKKGPAKISTYQY